MRPAVASLMSRGRARRRVAHGGSAAVVGRSCCSAAYSSGLDRKVDSGAFNGPSLSRASEASLPLAVVREGRRARFTRAAWPASPRG